MARIITRLREWRQIEADLHRMQTAPSEIEFWRQAQQIAALGSQVVPVIVGNLDRADARLLAAMGAVAALLDREEVVTALHQAILEPQRSDQGRMAAMSILERFLGQPPADELLASLRDPEGAALRSLEEVLDRAAGAPTLWIEYIQGLDRQEPDVVLSVVRALRQMGSERAVEPLRLIAQDVRGEIAAAALQALGTFRLPQAGWALQTLLPIVHPELRPTAERALRKLRFAGVAVEPLPAPDPGWRALVGPVEGSGQRSLWFLQLNRRTAQVRFLNVLLTDQAGAIEAVGQAQVPAWMLPPSRPVGSLHDLPLPDGSGALLMAEAPFDLGRRLVVEALAYNRQTQIPVAGVLRLLSPWLWGYGGADSLPPVVLPDPGTGAEALVAVSDRLLGHPAFLTWTVRSQALFRAAEESRRYPGWDREVWARRVAGDLFSDPAVRQVVSRRLVAMSEWLLLTGDEPMARLALATAGAIGQVAASDLPFLQALVRRDLEAVWRGIKEGTEPFFGLEIESGV